MIKKILMGAVLGGVILFAWGAFSWMILPWHENTIHTFKSEVAISQSIQANVPQSGIYILPSTQSNLVESPLVFASVYLKGMPATMWPCLIIALIVHMISAALVTWMLLQIKTLKYLGKLGFVVIFALTAGLVVDLPYWNWFRFDTNFIMVGIADVMIGWFLAGLILAKLGTAPRNHHTKFMK